MADRVRFADAPRPQFARAAGHERPGPPNLKGRAAARHLRMVRLAAELCPELPARGEHVHAMMTGFFDLCQVVTDVCRRTGPRALRITTLAWNRRNVLDLLELLDERQADPLPLTVIASDFFHEHNRELVDWARDQFAGHGVRLVAARSHCKVVAIDLGPGDGLVMEGSANLRTNRNREQLILIRDRPAHDWHAAWIDALAGAAS